MFCSLKRQTGSERLVLFIFYTPWRNTWCGKRWSRTILSTVTDQLRQFNWCVQSTRLLSLLLSVCLLVISFFSVDIVARIIIFCVTPWPFLYTENQIFYNFIRKLPWNPMSILMLPRGKTTNQLKTSWHFRWRYPQNKLQSHWPCSYLALTCEFPCLVCWKLSSTQSQFYLYSAEVISRHFSHRVGLDHTL